MTEGQMTEPFYEKFKHKIVTLPGLCAQVGGCPRDRKIILCHGMFDVVHPGHVHHLAYAKSKADLLVVNIIGDAHISRSADGRLPDGRPHIPERLRALNLAAFEMVDYVLIDPESKPLHTLEQLQPDFFAKGFEYVSDSKEAQVTEESVILHRYGGEVIFTPGNELYTSVRLAKLAPSGRRKARLLTLLNNHGLSPEDLRQTVSHLPGYRVHVVGDTIVDSLTQTSLIGGKTKTPTFSVLYEDRKDFVGGAGIVSKHLQAAGAEVAFSTVLGDDRFHSFVLEVLRAAGVTCRHIVDASRPTVNKNAMVCDGYHLLKLHRLDNRPVSEAILQRLVQNLRETPCDAVVFSDFRHGISIETACPA